MSALKNSALASPVVTAATGMILTSSWGVEVIPSTTVRVVLLVVVGMIATFGLHALLAPIQEMIHAALQITRGEPLGSAPGNSEHAIALHRGFRHLQREAESHRDTISAREARLGELAAHLEKLARGEISSDALALEVEKGSELERAQLAIRSLEVLLSELNSRAEKMAAGDTGVQEVEERVLATNRLSDADLAPGHANQGEFARNIIDLNSQLRRLTIQAKVVAQDNLSSPLLNERLPGDLGASFAAMVQNLRGLTERAQTIAMGDLTSFTEGDGELNNAFNVMVSELRQVVDQITQTAVRISTSAEEIIAVLKEQELSASHQASGVEETQRTMETLLSSAKMIAESAQTVFKSAERTQANNRIISDRASELKSHTERISEILESIKEIADRSDLLALNASLEGLRAGEAGKGFTLVANEMRRLAENIKGSVGDIKELLSDIRESALSSVMAIEEGTRLSDRTTDSALKITLITQQQQSGTEQVTQSMEELSHLINQGLAGTRQVTMAASELAELSDDMRKIVEAFRLDHTGPTISTRDWGASSRGSASFRSPRPTRRSQELHTSQNQLDARKLANVPREEGVAPDRSAEFKVSPAIEKNPMRQTLQVNRPEPSGAELNSTMRFVPGSDDEALLSLMAGNKKARAAVRDESPTIDVSALGDEISETPPGSDNQIDNLFEELSNTARGLNESSDKSEASDSQKKKS